MPEPLANETQRQIKTKIVHGHDDLGDDDFHQWVQIGRNVRADCLGRPNERMLRADWQPWICNNPDCRGEALVHLDAVTDLIVQALAEGDR